MKMKFGAFFQKAQNQIVRRLLLHMDIQVKIICELTNKFSYVEKRTPKIS